MFKMWLKLISRLIIIVVISDIIFCDVHYVDFDFNQEYSLFSIPYSYPLTVQSSTKGDLCVQHACKGKKVSEKKCKEYISGTTCLGPFLYRFTEPANPGEFPHVVFIKGKNSKRRCEGALISPFFVVTTALCVARDVDTVSIGNFTYSIPIKTVMIHPDYKTGEIKANIALIELSMEVTFSKSVRPACLWTEKEIPVNPKPIMTTITKEDGMDIVEINPVVLIDNEKCEIGHQRTRLMIDEFQYCGMPDEVCVVPASGSALQIVIEEGSTCANRLIGLASERINECTPEPISFTKISPYVYWIESVVWPGE